MGLKDIVSRVFTRYEADAGPHRREIESLARAEDKRAQGLVEANAKANKSFDEGLKTLAKYAAGVVSVGAAISLAKASWQTFAEQQKLSAAAVGVDIEKLRKSSAGLKTDMQLLRDAAKFQGGAFKLSAAEMDVAERAMRRFTQKSHDAAKAQEVVTQAVTALKVDGLKDMGVFVDMAGLSMEKAGDRAQIFQRIMAQLREETKGVNDNQQTTAERMAATGVAFTNAMDKIKLAIGQLVVQLQPLISKVAELVSKVPGLAKDGGEKGAQGVRGVQDALRGSWSPVRGADNAMVLDYMFGKGDYSTGAVSTSTFFTADAARRQRAAALFQEGHSEAAQQLLGGRGELAAILEGDASRLPDYLLAGLAGGPGTSTANAWAADPAKAAGGGGSLSKDQLAALARAKAYAMIALSIEGVGGVPVGGAGFAGATREFGSFHSLGDGAGGDKSIYGADISKLFGDLSVDPRAATKQWQDTSARLGAQRTSMLEQTIGPLDQFDAYKSAWTGLQGAIVAGYEAMVDGSMSFGKAFKMSIAQALKATGAEMLVMALKETAAGFASLALGPIGGVSAAGHFKAAAIYGAAAVAAGATSNALGGGGGAGGGGAGRGAAPTLPAGGGGIPYQGERVVYVIGDSFGETTSRERVNTLKRRTEEAFGSHGVRHE